MKCIQYYAPVAKKLGLAQKIVRVADDAAARAVEDRVAFYVSRKTWKDKVRDAKAKV